MATGRLKALGSEIWMAEGLLEQAGGALCFSLRMTVIQLPDGTLLLWSPIPIDDGLQAELEALGPVKHVIAPNGFHHLYVDAALTRFPSATLWLSPALEKKRPDLWSRGTPLEAPPAAWGQALELLTVQGVPAVMEVVAFHRASATLIATDLFFNEHNPRGWMTPWVLRMTGAYKQLAQSRLMRFLTKDKTAAAASYQRMLRFPFATLVIAHGDIVTVDARARTAEALGRIDPSLGTLPDPANATSP